MCLCSYDKAVHVGAVLGNTLVSLPPSLFPSQGVCLGERERGRGERVGEREEEREEKKREGKREREGERRE